jgi:hypothetical protein
VLENIEAKYAQYQGGMEHLETTNEQQSHRRRWSSHSVVIELLVSNRRKWHLRLSHSIKAVIIFVNPLRKWL